MVAQLVADDGQVLDPAVGQDVVVADHRDPQAPATEVPVDVEGRGVARRPPVLQQVPPPGVLGRRGHADVVGHDVDEDAHTEPPRLGGERGQPLGPAARGVDAVVRDDVVPVVAARARPASSGER